MSTSNVRTWVAACLVLSAGSGLLQAGEVPRYAPKPGQVLTYEEEPDLQGKRRKLRVPDHLAHLGRRKE